MITSLVLDPLLIPWFQQRMGNGGLGVCIATVVSEIIVLGCGIWLAPRGIFDRQFRRSLVPALVSGACMAIVARVLHEVTSFVAAPIAITVYIGCLWTTGGLDEAFISELRGLVTSRLMRLRTRQ